MAGTDLIVSVEFYDSLHHCCCRSFVLCLAFFVLQLPSFCILPFPTSSRASPYLRRSERKKVNVRERRSLFKSDVSFVSCFAVIRYLSFSRIRICENQRDANGTCPTTIVAPGHCRALNASSRRSLPFLASPQDIICPAPGFQGSGALCIVVCFLSAASTLSHYSSILYLGTYLMSYLAPCCTLSSIISICHLAFREPSQILWHLSLESFH